MDELFGTICTGLKETFTKIHDFADSSVLPSKKWTLSKKLIVIGLVVAGVLATVGYLVGRKTEEA